MRITEFTLQNVKCIEYIAVPVTSVVLVKGHNGSGKSTLVEGVRVMFDGGHNPDIIGPFGDKAVQTLRFDNGDVYTRATSKKRYTLEGVRGDGTPIKEPATQLKALVSGLSLVPTGLVDAKPADRVKFLQSAMPCQFTADDIKAALGDDAAVLQLPEQPLDVQAFRTFVKVQYERRTNINRDASQLIATRTTLTRNLPPDDGVDWAARVVELRALLAQANADAVKSTTTAGQVRDEEIDRLRKEAAEKIAEIQRQLQEDIDAVHREAAAIIAAHTAPYRAEVERLTGEIAAAEEKVAAQHRAEGTRKDIESVSKQAREKTDLAAKLDRVLDKLGKLEREKLEALPIPDVEIKDAQIYYKGLNFETQLNTAQQYILSFQVAALTLGDLQFMLFDGAEALDDEHMEEFIEGIKEAGFQVIMAQVAQQPLEVQQVA